MTHFKDGNLHRQSCLRAVEPAATTNFQSTAAADNSCRARCVGCPIRVKLLRLLRRWIDQILVPFLAVRHLEKCCPWCVNGHGLRYGTSACDLYCWCSQSLIHLSKPWSSQLLVDLKVSSDHLRFITKAADEQYQRFVLVVAAMRTTNKTWHG